MGDFRRGYIQGECGVGEGGGIQLHGGDGEGGFERGDCVEWVVESVGGWRGVEGDVDDACVRYGVSLVVSTRLLDWETNAGMQDA